MSPSFFLTTSRKILCAYNRVCEPLLAEYDIPQVSFDILMFLTNNAAYSTAQEISEMRHIKKNLVSVHVERLVRAGLLRRDPVAGDRRKIALSCTEKAQPIIEAGRRMQAQFFRDLTAGVDEEMWRVFGQINTQLASNAEQMIKQK